MTVIFKNHESLKNKNTKHIYIIVNYILNKKYYIRKLNFITDFFKKKKKKCEVSKSYN